MKAMETLLSLLALAEAMQVDLAGERKQPARDEGGSRRAALHGSPLDHRGEEDVTPVGDERQVA